MKRKKILAMQQAFSQLEKGQHSFKFSYFIARNNKLVKEEVEIWQKMILPAGKFKEYEDKRMDMIKKFAEKQSNGIYKIENGEYIIVPEKQKDFDKEIEKLKKRYKKALDEREKQMKDFDDSLENLDVDLKFSTIDIKDMPEEITPLQVEAFIELIVEK
jgi:hypothetical protein